jgi:hypothetical protein
MKLVYFMHSILTVVVCLKGGFFICYAAFGLGLIGIAELRKKL